MSEEKWICDDCSFTTQSPIDELAGKEVEKTVGEGRRKKEIVTVVCPNCESEKWHSETVRDAFFDGGRL